MSAIGSFSAHFDVGEMTQFNLTFVNQDLARRLKNGNKTGYSGGYQASVFVGIERRGCFTFGNSAEIHPNYLQEKVGNMGDAVAKNIATFLNTMIDTMNKVKKLSTIVKV